jgi:SAM-dependent methyltransferase
VTIREQRLVFGEVADEYDAVRAEYPPELCEAVVRYAGAIPRTIVEVGAGTGLATQTFAPLGAPITCIEPDPEMASVLARKFAGDQHIDVVVGRFEDWMPPAAGVELLYCAQAWHWVDPATRFQLAHDAVAPDGVLALFGHAYMFVDDDVADAIHEVYRQLAPSLLDQPAQQRRPSAPSYAPEMRGSGRWSEVRDESFERTVAYSSRDYVRLLGTFSGHRMLAPALMVRVHDRVVDVVDARGGVVENLIRTGLTLGRRTV